MEGAPPWATSHVGLRSPGKKVNSEGLYAPGSQPEKKINKETKKDTGEPSYEEARPKLYFPGKLIYLELYIENNGRCIVMQSQQS